MGVAFPFLPFVDLAFGTGGGELCLFLLGASLFSLCFCLLAGRYSTAAAAAADVNVFFFALVVEVIIYTTDMTGLEMN